MTGRLLMELISTLSPRDAVGLIRANRSASLVASFRVQWSRPSTEQCTDSLVGAEPLSKSRTRASSSTKGPSSRTTPVISKPGGLVGAKDSICGGWRSVMLTVMSPRDIDWASISTAKVEATRRARVMARRLMFRTVPPVQSLGKLPAPIVNFTLMLI